MCVWCVGGCGCGCVCGWVGGCVCVWRVCSLLTFLVCYTTVFTCCPITPNSSGPPACSSVSTGYPPSGSDSTVTVFSSPKDTSAVVVSIQNIIASRCMRC